MELKKLSSGIKTKIENKTARVCVVGLGYVGMPLVMALIENGYTVIGYDTDKSKIEDLNNGISYLEHINVSRYRNCITSTLFTAVDNSDLVTDCDIFLICVPTPLTKNRDPDLSCVYSVCEMLSQRVNNGSLVVLESTTWPGTTRMLKSTYFEHCFVAYSPEREDPGNDHYWLGNTPKIVGGVDKIALEIAGKFYSSFLSNVYRVETSEIAEMAKIYENAFRLVNIAFVNEIKMICEKMGVPIADVIKASDTKPFGFKAFWPGPGIGGHCVPIDPYYLNWKAKEVGTISRMIELAGDILDYQCERVVNKVFRVLNDVAKTVKQSRILVIGAAYKKNIGDLRESPAMKIIDELHKVGADVRVYDPCISHDGFKYPIEGDLLRGVKFSDLTLILTDHDCIDWSVVSEYANILIDTRNVIDDCEVYRV